MNDKEIIISFLNQFSNPKKGLNFCQQCNPDFLFIKSSGNPKDVKGFEQMISSDLVQEKLEITKTHRLEFFRESILMCFFKLVSNLLTKGY